MFAVTALITASALRIRIRGAFVHPPFFLEMRRLFAVQQGLFFAAILSLLLVIIPRLRLPMVARIAVYWVFYFWFSWIAVWGWIQHSYGIELTPDMAFEIFTNWHSMAQVGFVGNEFFYFIALVTLLWIGLIGLTVSVVSRCGQKLRFASCISLLGLFALVHVAVRTYFVYQINRNQPAVLAYDDRALISLHSEKLIPGLRSERDAFPNLASASRTDAYLRAIRELPVIPLPLRPNILWINLESFRFDAIKEETMPRLSGYRDRFQIRLQEDHWSGGNATHFGVFSMLTGLSGEQFENFRKTGAKAPFLSLLAHNGYGLRFGKKRYFEFGGLKTFIPSDATMIESGGGSLSEQDRVTIDKYLADVASSPAGTARFDFLPLDSTHWPYIFPDDQAPFQPAPSVRSSLHMLRSEEEIANIRNRYRNACHFIDSQVGRVLDELQQRNGFANTIVIVLGDHGEEFQERGQLTHASVLNDFQGRTALWIHLPGADSGLRQINRRTVHLDIVPTLLQVLGFKEDILYTQGRSLLEQVAERPMFSLCEQGFAVPLYRALVTETYISRWLRTPTQYLFSGVQRRDGNPVEGTGWLSEVRQLLPHSAEMYEVLPDTTQPPRKFSSSNTPTTAGR